MKRFIVLGNPIEQSLSPFLHNWIFKKFNINAKYYKLECDLEDLVFNINKLRENSIHGLNITIPFKNKVIDHLDIINDRARIIGSVNCIKMRNNKVMGFNTDWFGFSKLLIDNKIDVFEKEIIVFGAGGAAKAIIYSLILNGIKKIRLFNRKIENAQKLENSFVSAHSLKDLKYFVKKDSIIVNCTPLGMNNKKMPFNEKFLNKNQLIIDTIYNLKRTKLLDLGEKKGAFVINGLDMFIYQGIASLDLWLEENIFDIINIKEIKQIMKEKLC